MVEVAENSNFCWTLIVAREEGDEDTKDLGSIAIVIMIVGDGTRVEYYRVGG